MNKALLGKTVAVLVANGFLEKDLTMMQKAMLNAGAHLKIISIESGLVNSWGVEEWGLNFAVDKGLNRSLAADFDLLVVPGGARSVQKLMQTAHTKRFLNGFLDSNKRVAFFDDAVRLLVHIEKADDVTIAGPSEIRDDLMSAGAKWVEDTYSVSDLILTGLSNEETREDFVRVAISFFMGRDVSPVLDQAA